MNRLQPVILLCMILITVLTLPVAAADTITRVWDVTNSDFEQSIAATSNVERLYRNGNPLYYSIKRDVHTQGPLTDLYLSFDNKTEFDETGSYRLQYNRYHTTDSRTYNKQSAYFLEESDMIDLVGTDRSFFQAGENLGSFSISFWILPVTYSNGEVILKIGSQYYNRQVDNIEDQSIVAKLYNGKIIWDFNNLFELGHLDIKREKLSCESFSRIEPEQWNKVTLTYDAYKGIVYQYINGMQQSVMIATVDGTTSSSTLNMKFHKTNRCVIKIAPSFTGAMDEFVITKTSEYQFRQLYPSDGGELVSTITDFGSGGVYIRDFSTGQVEGNNAQLFYYYRHSMKPFYEDPAYSSNIKWKKIGSEDIEFEKIRFFQWKAVFMPGNDGKKSPLFRSMRVTYVENDPPARPQGLVATLENNTINLRWYKGSEKDLIGYKVYYGTRSGFYFTQDALEGKSPIDVGNTNTFSLSNLKKNTIYYITVTAYDDEEHIHESGFAREISIRVLDDGSGMSADTEMDKTTEWN
jgi:hypothetical protein